MYDHEIRMVEQRWRSRERFKSQMYHDISKLCAISFITICVTLYANTPDGWGAIAMVTAGYASVMWAGFRLIRE